ncbi:unnamed protein product, partial [Mesorhabditis belari]|uniref:Uncharacterized protein n=1 Tax=Mesorhabditis belari TaxID=2138241 RepID=A0AAF3EG89_9BILA
MLQSPLRYLSSSYGNYTAATTHRGALCLISDLIDYFFVAHPLSGRREGEEHKRVMYFYTQPGTPPDKTRQTEVTGFAEAIVNFMNDFSDKENQNFEGDFPYRDVMTDKTAQVYVQVEHGEFLLGISFDKQASKNFEYTIFMPTLRSVLIEAYKMFKLFFGPMEDFRRADETLFQQRLDYFFGRYFSQLRLFNMPLLNHFIGVDFQPLNGTPFLTIETLLAEVKEDFPAVSKMLFLYQDKLLYYSVSKADLPSLYRYLTENLLPMSLRAELEPNTRVPGGKWLTGPTDLQNDLPITLDCSPPTVFLTAADESYEEHKLLVYRSLNATICLFVNTEVTRLMMRNMDGFLGAELPKLASMIGESISTENSELRVSDFHYIYYNPSSLSLRTSFHQSPLVGGITSKNTPQLPAVPQSVHNIVCETYDRLLEASEDFGECIVKESRDWWIVIKKVNERILVLLLPPTFNIPSLQEAHSRIENHVFISLPKLKTAVYFSVMLTEYGKPLPLPS